MTTDAEFWRSEFENMQGIAARMTDRFYAEQRRADDLAASIIIVRRTLAELTELLTPEISF